MTMDRMSNPSVREVAEAEVNRAADLFLAQLAGVTDNPADALRQQRWLEAQEASDARLRASLGGHAWMALHRDANRSGSEAASNDGPLPPSSSFSNEGASNQAPVRASLQAD